MITFFQVVHILICLSLIGLILIQAGKGQGLAGAFGSFAGGTAQNLFGARTTDVLTKVTAYLTVVFFVSAFFLAYLQVKGSKSVIQFDKNKAAMNASVSKTPTKEAADMSKKLDDLTNKLLNSSKSLPAASSATDNKSEPAPAKPSEAANTAAAAPALPVPASSEAKTK